MYSCSEVIPATRSTLAAVSLSALCMLVVALTAYFYLQPNSRITYDEQSHHLPAIRTFAQQLPAPELRDYPVATTPGYHLLMAAAVRYAGIGETGLRGLNLIISIGLAGVVGWTLGRRMRTREAILLGLPLMTCVYVVTSAAWILPENAAWGLVALILSLALLPTTPGTLAGMSIALLVLVLVRQPHAWCGAVILAATVMDAARPGDRLRRGVIGLAATVPAAIAVGAFVWMWGGLVPPMFQPGGREYELSTQYGGWGPAAAAFTMALAGFYGVWLAPWFWQASRQRCGRGFWLIIGIGLLAGFVVSVLPETSYQVPHRRSGIWRLIQMAPTIGERSPVLIALAMVGGAVTAMTLAAQSTRTRVILLTALVMFVAAQTANPMIWQRYYEPMVLLWLIVSAAQVEQTTTIRVERFLRWIGPIGLTAFQVAVTVHTLRGGGE